MNPPSGIESVGILIDGRVSLMGLAASVDDLSLTYIVAGGGSALDPSKWRVDLAGFADRGRHQRPHARRRTAPFTPSSTAASSTSAC